MIAEFENLIIEDLDDFLFEFPEARDFYIKEMQNANYKYDENNLEEDIYDFYYNIDEYLNHNDGTEYHNFIDMGDIINAYLKSVPDKLYIVPNYETGYQIIELDIPFLLTNFSYE